MRRSTGESSDANVIVVPDADAPTVDPRATFVRSGTRYSWGLVHGSYAVWKGRRARRPIEVYDRDSMADAERRFKDLEATARLRSARRRSFVGRWGRRLAVGAIVVALGVSVGALLGSLQGWGGDAEPSLKGGAVTEAIRYDDPSGGFSMRVPAGWNVVTSASGATQLVSQDGDVTVSIESMPAGDLGEVAADFMNSATDGWDDVSFESPVERELGGRPAIAYGGTAVDGSGEEIRFLAIVADDADGEHHGMLVLVPLDWDAATGFAPIEEIASSLKPA